MAQGATVRVNGYREFLRAINRADRESKRYVRTTFAHVGESVRREATSRFLPIDVRSATSYRVVVRTRGIAVEQTRRRTTGKRPDFGRLQMRRALVPALEANAHTLERELEHALDLVATHFERPA